MEHNKYGDNYGTVITDGGYLDVTVLPEKVFWNKQNSYKRIFSYFFSIHCWFLIRYFHKYYHSKTAKRIELNTILEVIDDQVVINLLMNFKYIGIVLDPGSPLQNMSHYTRFIFCETNVRY